MTIEQVFGDIADGDLAVRGCLDKLDDTYLTGDGDLWCVLETDRRLCTVLVIKHDSNGRFRDSCLSTTASALCLYE